MSPHFPVCMLCFRFGSAVHPIWLTCCRPHLLPFFCLGSGSHVVNFILFFFSMSRASAAARWSDEESEDESQRVMAPAASHRTCKGPVPSHGSVAAAESYAAADSDSSKYSVLIFLNVFPDVMTSKERRVKTVVGLCSLFYHLGSRVVDFGYYFSHCYFFF